jgi:hypothetical protein
MLCIIAWYLLETYEKVHDITTLNKNINTTCNHFKDLTELQFIRNSMKSMECSTAHRIELIRQLIVACGMLSHSSSLRHSAHNVDISKPLTNTTPYNTVCHLPGYSWNRDSSVKSTLLQRASGHGKWAFAHGSRLRRRTAVRSRPWWGQFFGCANAKFHQLSRSLFSDDPVGEEVLPWLHVVCRPVGRTAKFSKRHWKRLMVEKWALNYLGTTLLVIPAVSIPIARSLKTWDI